MTAIATVPRRSAASMRSRFAALVVRRLRDHGLSAEADRITLELGLGGARDPDASEISLPLDVYRALSERVADALGDPFLGLHVAMDLPRGSFGLFEFAIRSSPTLGEALARVTRYLPLLNESLVVTVEPGARGVAIVHRVPGEPTGGGRHANEFRAMQATHLPGGASAS